MAAPAAETSHDTFATLRRHPWAIVLALVALAIALLILFWDWNWFRGPIERIVTARTGRSFDIGGDLDVDLGRTTRIRADALSFGNAAWAREPTMASTDRLEFGIEVWPLLRRQVRIPELRLQRPRLLLEKGPGDVGNWVFGDRKSTLEPEFGRLWIDDGRLRFADKPRKTDVDVDVHSTRAGPGDAAPPIAVDGSGHWQGQRFKVQGRAESPLQLRDQARPYRVDMHAQAGATRAHARGTLLDPLRLRDFDLKLALAGANLEDLYPLLGIATPATPPYALDGRLTRTIKGDRTTWHYEDFTGTVGDSDLSGTAAVTLGGPRPFLRANLVSRRLDFDDLAGFVGGAPQSGESSNPELRARAAHQAAVGKLLPDTPYELDKLRAMDADVRWKAHRISAPKLPLDDMDGHLLLDDGLLRLDPLNFGVAGGDIKSNIRMDARESPIRTKADIAARGLNLGPLMPDVPAAKEAIGKVGGNVALAGTGNSIAKMLASSNGSAAVGMGRGQVSNLLMELAGLDVQEALKFLIGKDKRIPVRCAFGDFVVRDGIMTTRALAFDTTDTIIVGDGTINLRDETLHLRLRPRPKDRSLFVFRSPLLVDGTFRNPAFHPDMARVGLRGAFAMVLANIAPPAALLATMELGGGKDADCGGHYAR